jgi:hypothetical protein
MQQEMEQQAEYSNATYQGAGGQAGIQQLCMGE